MTRYFYVANINSSILFVYWFMFKILARCQQWKSKYICSLNTEVHCITWMIINFNFLKFVLSICLFFILYNFLFIISLSKGLSPRFMCSDQHVKYWMPPGFPLTSSLLLDYHVKQYIHTHTYTQYIHTHVLCLAYELD